MKISENLGSYITFAVLLFLGSEFPFLLTVFGWFLIALVSLLITGAIVLFVVDAIYGNKLKKLLKQNNGAFFLVYSSNKRLKSTIESELRPQIDIDYTMIYREKEETKSKLDQLLSSHLLYQTESKKFPRLIKIENEQIICVSLYSEVYQLKWREIDKEEFKRQVGVKLNTLKNEQIRKTPVGT